MSIARELGQVAGRAFFLSYLVLCRTLGFSGGTVVKYLPANAGDTGSIPGSGRSPGGGNGNPLSYSCLKNPMDEEPGSLQSMGLQRVGHT